MYSFHLVAVAVAVAVADRVGIVEDIVGIHHVQPLSAHSRHHPVAFVFHMHHHVD